MTYDRFDIRYNTKFVRQAGADRTVETQDPYFMTFKIMKRILSEQIPITGPSGNLVLKVKLIFKDQKDSAKNMMKTISNTKNPIDLFKKILGIHDANFCETKMVVNLEEIDPINHKNKCKIHYNEKEYSIEASIPYSFYIAVKIVPNLVDEQGNISTDIQKAISGGLFQTLRTAHLDFFDNKEIIDAIPIDKMTPSSKTFAVYDNGVWIITDPFGSNLTRAIKEEQEEYNKSLEEIKKLEKEIDKKTDSIMKREIKRRKKQKAIFKRE